MQPDASSIPHSLLQVLWLVLASSLGWLGGWVTRRKREPVELEKLRAETRTIHITAENSQVGVGLETLREIQSVIEKAERRREEWQAREDELRSQIRFWRCKAEELDGQLIDSRDANVVLQGKLASAQDDAKAAQMFVEQINMAAKLKGVSLSEFTPQQLNPKDKQGPV